MLIDSHCHLDRLDLTRHDGDLGGAVSAARDNGVAGMLCVSITLEAYPEMRRVAGAFENVWFSVGVHPTEREGHEPTVDELVAAAADSRVVALGETGLDYYWVTDDAEWQRERFRTHIRAARQAGKPLIIHSRDAKEDTLELMAAERAQQTGGVMHCFADDWDMARRAMELGFYISFSGIVTFKNAVQLKEVAQRVPLDRMLVETDSPYLAPVPYRGKPNEPAYVRHVAEHIAELRGMTLEDVARATTENFYRLFG